MITDVLLSLQIVSQKTFCCTKQGGAIFNASTYTAYKNLSDVSINFAENVTDEKAHAIKIFYF